MEKMDCMSLSIELKKSELVIPENCFYDIYKQNDKWTLYIENGCTEGTGTNQTHVFHSYLKNDHFVDEL